jgi:antitoxin component YwqK of YwqJK toxin-antitoxin module
MKNGIREGNWLFYYDSGQLLLKGYYINGKKNGEEITYYENGTILSKGEYKDDKRVLPTWKIYDVNGKPIL